jgi:UDP-N-acetylglucosamine diphosphorylase / glucose-1-phosphate thymidylyltransferase / UDP-N-acetylgalactosamine diphosphorylase / glucosamine-1-phosphate N-acetyltransferase / galactosamine-1-phosphate N-acetyltransferase
MHVVIFEGCHWTSLAPLSLSRPVFMMRSGTGTLLESQLRHLRPTRLSLWVRPEMVPFVQLHVLPKLKVPTSINEPLDDTPAMVISARTLHFAQFDFPDSPCAVVDEGDIIRSAWVRSPGLGPADVMNRTDAWLKLLDSPRVKGQSRLVERPWDLLSWNEESLVEGSLHGDLPHAAKPVGPYHLVQPENVFFHEGVKIAPGVVLDAGGGPITIGRGANIGANTVIQGPAYVGDYTQLMPLTYLRPGTSIGPHCKIGGEVSNSIIEANVNKIHYGFIGDSYIGEWVNLGAGTTTSNLKNTYDTVSMTIAGKTYNTGRKFVGAIVGDHAKTAIGTRLMAGTYVGYASSLAGSTIPARYVPSFSFVTDKGTEPYRLDKALQVMQAVYARRNRNWTEADTAQVEVTVRMAHLAEKVQ